LAFFFTIRFISSKTIESSGGNGRDFFWNLKKKFRSIPAEFFFSYFFPDGKKQLNRNAAHVEMLSVLLLLKSNKIPNKFHSFKKGKKRRDQTEQVASG